MDFSKFDVKLNDNDVDCRAFILNFTGKFQRIGADENNNVTHNLSQSEVSEIIEKYNVNFNDLITEKELQEQISSQISN